MTSRPKLRRKKPIEALDWRELAEAPALRGLTEVLSTPPEVARERAAKRESVHVGETPTVGGSTGDQIEEGSNQRGGHFPALPKTPGIDEPSGEMSVVPAAGKTPSEPVRDLAAFPEQISAGVSTTVGVQPSVGEPAATKLPPGVGVTPTVVLNSSEGLEPSDSVSPTEEETPIVPEPDSRGIKRLAGARAIDLSHPAVVKPSVVYRPTVGVTPVPKRQSWWVDTAGMRYEAKRVQRVIIAQHSMSLGEERVYETLWHGRESDGVLAESRRSKTFSLGYDRIARLVRLNEKSVRILLPKLIAKRILEVVAAEDSASRIGRTYRIFSYEEILERQRAANLTAVVKNGRAVEFVWPVDDAPTVGVSPAMPPPSERLAGDSPTVGASTSACPGDLASRVRAVVPAFDEEALKALWTNCARIAPDCTVDEVEYCLQLKAQQLLSRGKSVNNPVGLMLWAVPKCFEGQSALHLVYRRQKQAEEELRRREDERFQAQMEEYKRLAADPATSPEDRAWYQRMLADLG